MLKESEIYQSMIDHTHDETTRVTMSGDMPESLHRNEKKLHTAAGIAHGILDVLNSTETSNLVFDYDTIDGLEAADSFWIGEQRKVENLIQLLIKHPSLFRRPKEAKLFAEVEKQIAETSQQIDKIIDKIEADLREKQNSLRVVDKPRNRERIHVPALKWVAIGALVSLALLGEAQSTKAADNQPVEQVSHDDASASIEGALHQMSPGLAAMLNEAQRQLHVDFDEKLEAADSAVTDTQDSPEAQANPENKAASMVSIVLTDDEKRQMNVLAALQKAGPEDAVSFDLPESVNASTFRPDLTSDFRAKYRDILRQALEISKTVPGGTENMRIIFMRHQGANGEEIVTPLVGFKVDVPLEDHTLSAKTLIAFTEGGLRYLDIPLRTFNGEVVTSDVVTAVVTDQELSERLAPFGIKTPADGEFMLVAMSTEAQGNSPAGTIESVLTDTSATITYNPTTGTPDSPLVRTPVAGVTETPVPVAVPEAPTTAGDTQNVVRPDADATLTASNELQANYILDNLPIAGEVNINNRPTIGKFFESIPNRYPGGSSTLYGTNYYEINVPDLTKLNYGDNFVKRAQEAQTYAESLNSQFKSGNVAEVVKTVVFYTNGSLTIANLVTHEFPFSAETSLKAGSLIIQNEDGSHTPFSIENTTDHMAPISYGDVVNSLSASNMLSPGQKTIEVAPGKIVNIDDLLKQPDQLIIAEMQKTAGSETIVSVTPVGKFMDATATPAATSTPFPDVTLTPSNGEKIVLPNEYEQTPLAPEYLSQNNLDTGTTFTVKNGNNTKEITVAVSGINASDLVLSRSFENLASIEGYSVGPNEKKENIQIIVVDNANEIDSIISQNGATKVPSEGYDVDVNGSSQAGLRYALSDSSGETLTDYVFMTKAYVEKFYNHRSDQDGVKIPLGTAFSRGITESMMVALKLRERQIQNPTSGPTDTSHFVPLDTTVVSMNGNIEPDIFTVTIPEPQQ